MTGLTAAPYAEALPVAVKLAEALAEAYARGVIHRDLKPANVVVTPAGKVKVLDFGVARMRSMDLHLQIRDLLRRLHDASRGP